jgi:hypothetical protein
MQGLPHPRLSGIVLWGADLVTAKLFGPVHRGISPIKQRGGSIFGLGLGDPN